MDNKSYYVSKNKKKKEVVYLEYDKLDGYNIKPKVNSSEMVEVSKVVFVKPEFSEKIIRKKIDKEIEYLLTQLKIIEENDGNDEEGIKRNLIDAEKLRIQIINNYVKYLGHTYHSLTLKKIQIIINQLRYKLYTIRDIERENNLYFERESNNFEREGRRGRYLYYFLFFRHFFDI